MIFAEELAYKAGLDRNYVGGIEHRESNLSPKNIATRRSVKDIYTRVI